MTGLLERMTSSPNKGSAQVRVCLVDGRVQLPESAAWSGTPIEDILHGPLRTQPRLDVM
jgi:hypothetical protein